MMTLHTPPVHDQRLARSCYASRGTWFVGTLALLSLALHAGLIITLSLRGAPAVPPTENQGTVELLMVEHKGAEASQAGLPAEAQPSAEARPKEQAAAKQALASTPPAPAPPAGEPNTEPVPPAPATPAAEAKPIHPEAAQQAVPAERAAPTGPVFDFDGTDSDTNAMVLSGRILPASPDNRFRNQPPTYPLDAAMRNESGDVRLVIHVAADGLATGAEVVISSGWASLDQAAVAAVRKWRFHPALKDGHAVPFDMSFIFNFRAN